uniref:Uncharacterized protein n=1 Tax=Oryza meridionalis TaxID=40149 RepID=A0A0E0EDB9_9ORYZ
MTTGRRSQRWRRERHGPGCARRHRLWLPPVRHRHPQSGSGLSGERGRIPSCGSLRWTTLRRRQRSEGSRRRGWSRQEGECCGWSGDRAASIILVRIGCVGLDGKSPAKALPCHWPADDGDAFWRRSPPWRRRFGVDPSPFPTVLRVKTWLRLLDEWWRRFT